MHSNFTSTAKMLPQRTVGYINKLKLKFIAFLAIMLFSLNLSAHTWEIRVKQNQDGSLTWYGQSYHGVRSCGILNSGIRINGINYNWTAEFAGSVVPLTPYIFTASPAYTACCNVSGRVSYATVTTAYIPGNLVVTAYSTNACYALYPDMPPGSGVFLPPPPPVCTTCPVTGWSNTVTLPGNNNGTSCDPTDDFTTANIKVNHLACANITGDRQFRVIFDPAGANVSYGPINYAAGIETNVVINIPYGTSNSTQVKVIDDDFPCEVQHGLSIPGGQYQGERETEPPAITCPENISVSNDPGQCGANVSFAATATDNCSATVSYSHAPGSFFPVGTTTVTATATDPSNNSSSCSFTVTVTDNEAPVIALGPVLSCYADNNFGCNINLGATTSDNCAIASFTSDAPACFLVGTTEVTWTATDIHGNTSTATQLVTRNPEINIDICAGPTRTIYTGVGPQSVSLSATVTGGTPGYTYSWSPSAGLSSTTSANPTASPTGTTTYTLTVTDSRGCTRSLSITINVSPMSAAVCSLSGNNVKFSVCHIPPGDPSNPQNICISANALNAHLTSGSNGHNNCYLGPCGQQLCFSTVPGAANLVQTKGAVEEETAGTPVIVEESKDEPTDAFKVHVYPNPSAGEFSLQVISNSMEPIRVRIMDMNGSVKSVSNVVSKTNVIRVGANLLGGTYIAEVTQGENRQVIKLVKLN